jgi:hypothetical protein
MQLALEYGIEPKNMALGAIAGVAVLLEKAEEYNLPGDLCFTDWRKLNSSNIEKILNWLWKGQMCNYVRSIVQCTKDAKECLVSKYIM